MRNQTSFRLTTTVLPTDKGADHKAKVTQVINKVNESGEKYYPTFTEETVVLTNDDRTIMETVRAVCNNGVMEFVKRGLNDTEDATEWQNRALTWNPGTLCFITAGASDWIDKDDDITWTGDQTYTGDLISTGSATYRGALVTEKGVQYPHFDNVSALEACTWAFGGMFAVVDSTGELYRYNAVTQEWSVVESSTPTNPEMADDETIGTVRIATDAEFEAGTDTGSHGEYLVATPSQIQGVTPEMNVQFFNINADTDLTAAQAAFDFLKDGGLPIIKKTTQYRTSFYYVEQDYFNDFVSFFRIVPSDSSFSTERIKLNYTGTTVTSIVFN